MSHRNGQLPARNRGRNGLRIHQRENPLLQRTHLPREQDARRKSR